MTTADHPPSDFAQLIALTRISPSHFRSVAQPFRPGAARGVFGGHLLAQSLYAASLTVPLRSGLVCNSLQAQFLAANTDAVPFNYHVDNVRDGGTYRIRQVRVYQNLDPDNPDHETYVYTCFVSFKYIEGLHDPVYYAASQVHGNKWGHIPAPPPVNHIVPDNLPSVPDIDLPMWVAWASDPDSGFVQIKHAVDVRRAPEQDPATIPDNFEDRRMYHSYKTILPLPDDDPNMHLAAHIYASDRNSLFTSSRLINRVDDINRVVSLSHTIIFYPPSKPSRGLFVRADKSWNTMESWTTRSGDGRLSYVGRMYDDEGEMFAEFMQDGLCKFGDLPPKTKL
ncbi:thioesterase-like superfamily-domain-containing protein [Myxozyma melibiosi]|uniref:Thioesterase-like superfamily-domain-containing protein n=1 Tax=Myxozyma melibiosi TaxID=54550 RepID=A0ABR1F620_9ASCO